MLPQNGLRRRSSLEQHAGHPYVVVYLAVVAAAAVVAVAVDTIDPDERQHERLKRGHVDRMNEGNYASSNVDL